MYGYGYRYPRVPRVVNYEDPNYRFKWFRAAIGNRAVSAKSPWIAFLKREHAFENIGNYLRELADAYREENKGLKESTKKGARQRITKLERAIAALQDQPLIQNVATDLGDKFNPAYVNEAISRLNKEIASLKAALEWKPSGQPKKEIKLKTTGEGYGLTSGLGYGEGYGYFY
jgi:hypothetical protein